MQQLQSNDQTQQHVKQNQEISLKSKSDLKTRLLFVRGFLRLFSGFSTFYISFCFGFYLKIFFSFQMFFLSYFCSIYSFLSYFRLSSSIINLLRNDRSANMTSIVYFIIHFSLLLLLVLYDITLLCHVRRAARSTFVWL